MQKNKSIIKLTAIGLVVMILILGSAWSLKRVLAQPMPDLAILDKLIVNLNSAFGDNLLDSGWDVTINRGVVVKGLDTTDPGKGVMIGEGYNKAGQVVQTSGNIKADETIWAVNQFCVGQNGDDCVSSFDDLGGGIGGESYWIKDGENIYYDDGKVGIGVKNPNGILQINGAISRQATTLNGSRTDTHVNLGRSSETGRNNTDWRDITISGGYDNKAEGQLSTISGGSGNTITTYGHGGVIAGGLDNTANNLAVVSGGRNNIADGQQSTITGGTNNSITGISNMSSILGGGSNTIDGWDSVILGGYGNSIKGNYSCVGGTNMQVNANETFVWGYSKDPVEINQSDAFIIYSGDVGVGTIAPNEKLEVNGGIRLNTVSPRPVCNVDKRGSLWFNQGKPGVKDSLEICAKDASGYYLWRVIY
ncbi:MAG: hypothetical protein PHS07_02250 [Patescibacteria group bacterium]|nr:hypothetical protein [Patescibacteria group bacterium]